jgi:hypothetical protein
MSFKLSVCSAEDIEELNQRKEYTLISTGLLQCIFTDPHLNAQAIKCWQLLFNMARFHSNLEITISYTKLAKELRRSKRSVIRYIQTLVKYGYLEAIANFDNEKGKKPNTLLIRVPTFVVEQVKASKDRFSYKPKSTNEVLEQCIPQYNSVNQFVTQPYPIENSGLATPVHSHETTGLEVSPKIQTDQSHFVSTQIEFPISQPELKTITIVQGPTELPSIDDEYESHSELEVATVPQEEEKEPKKKDMVALQEITYVSKLTYGASDKTVTDIININRNNNNKGPVVVSDNSLQYSTDHMEFQNQDRTSLTIEQQIDQLKREQENLKILDREEGQKLLEMTDDYAGTYKHLRYLGAIRSKIQLLQIELEKLEKQVVSNHVKYTQEEMFKGQIDHMLKKPGGIAISLFTFKRLLKILESLGYNGTQLSWLVNEIIFEVKFGNLKRNKTGEPLSADHAINIALKLVREKRWATPVLFKKTIGLN